MSDPVTPTFNPDTSQPYSAAIWNAWVRGFYRTFEGRFCKLTSTEDFSGIVVDCTLESEWHHPWWTTVTWDGDRFVASFKPGFVNAQDAFIVNDDGLWKGQPVALSDPDKTASLGGLEWRNPILGTFQSADEDGNVSYGAGEGYPDYFINLGVAPASPGGANQYASYDPLRTRQIRACDIFLSTPRLQSVTTVDGQDATQGTGAGVSIETFVSANAVDAAVAAFILKAIDKWVAPANVDPADILTGGDVTPPTTDEVLICTIYMVSPPESLDDDPTFGWTPYIKYSRFWNLAYASLAQPTASVDTPITFNAADTLGDGVAANIISGLVSDLNDPESDIIAYFNSVNVSGSYWDV